MSTVDRLNALGDGAVVADPTGVFSPYIKYAYRWGDIYGTTHSVDVVAERIEEDGFIIAWYGGIG